MKIKPLLIRTFLVFIVFMTIGIQISFGEETEEKKEAQNTSTASNVIVNIGEIVVQEKQVVPAEIDLPASIDVLGYEQIKYENVDNAMDLLWKVPGISVGDYGSGGYPNAFTLRGHDLMSHGNHTVITVDGIPICTHLENADGGSDLNSIAPDEIDSIEVVKGPIDARYGNWNRAGVIHYNLRNRGDFLKANTQIGSWGTEKIYASIGSEHFENKFNQIYSAEYYSTDGWRDHSGRERKNAYGRWFYRPSDEVEVGVATHAYEGTWDSAGYISQSKWEENYRQRATDNDDGGYKELIEGALHLDWRIRPEVMLETKLWVMDNTFARYTSSATSQSVAFRDNQTYGYLANLAWEPALAGEKKLRLDWGMDYRRFDDHTENWGTTKNRVKVNNTAYGDYLFNNYGTYLKANFDPFGYLRLFAGVRQDWFDGDKTDNTSTLEKEMKDYDVTSWKTGVIVSPLQWLSIYGNLATTFQLPTSASKYDSNPSDAREFMFWETGVKVNPVDWLLFRYAYSQQEEERHTQDPVTLAWIFEGDALRNVHEAELNFKVLKDIELFTSYTYHDTEYTGGTNKGKVLAYIPEHIWKAGFGYTFPWKSTKIQAWYNKVGSYFTNAANTYSYGGYDTIDMKVIHHLGKKWTVSLDGKNLADEKYAGFVYAGSAGNVYAVSNPRSVYLSLKYEF